MTRLVVDAVGPATSVQDFGRSGAQRYGLGTAGALDRLALAEANALVGLPIDAAAIEIGPFGARFTAKDGPVRVAITGAERRMAHAGKPVANNVTVLLAEGETLDLQAARGGVFSYLAIEGGIAADPVLGSLSVHARVGLGSPYPRPLQPGDALPVHAADLTRPERRLTPAPRAAGPIRVVLGPQDDYFSPETIAQFQATAWRISPTSDRMGYRLEGERLHHARGHNIVSDGIANGGIQIPGSGLPLVLLADRGTTGGYPKIATIISADLGRFAQTPVGGTVRFAAVPVEAAQVEARRMAALMRGLAGGVAALGGHLTSEALLGVNLAGDAVSAGEEWDYHI